MMEYDDTLLRKWREEQHRVASKAIVPKDASWNLEDPCVIVQDHGACGDGIWYKNISNTGRHEDKLYGGVDVSFPSNNYSNRGDLEHKAVAVYVVVKGTNIVYQDWEIFDLKIPYISSYLSFREIDPLERLVKKQLKERSDLTPEAILVDGNGIFHCRRAGIAVFLGVRTCIKTIGIGKSFYYNHEKESDKNIAHGLTRQKVENELKEFAEQFRKFLKSNVFSKLERSKTEKYSKNLGLIICRSHINDEVSSVKKIDTLGIRKDSSWEECIREISSFISGFAVKLQVKNDVCGAVLVCHGGRHGKYRIGTKNPIYVSIGNNISLEEALQICSELSYSRIPEPVRKADLLGREIMRKLESTRI